MALILTTAERSELERRASSRTICAEDAKRAKVILMLADGTSYSTIEAHIRRGSPKSSSGFAALIATCSPARHLHVGARPGPPDPPLHSPLQSRRKTHPMELQ